MTGPGRRSAATSKEPSLKGGAMQVIELWRHPVKSLRGEQLTEMVVEASGAIGDHEGNSR